MHEVLVNLLGDLSLPRKSVVRLTDQPDMTLDVYRGRKTITKKKPKEQATDRNNKVLISKILWKQGLHQRNENTKVGRKTRFY